MRNSILVAACLGALGCAAAYAGTNESSPSLILSGPVESVDANSVTVLNHRVLVTNAAGYGLQVGQPVSVYGEIKKDGSISDATVTPSATQYVAGADTVSLKGEVTAVDTTDGQLQVGGTSVDYTPLLGNTSFQVPAVGDVIEISGSQPLSTGVVLAGKIASGAGVAISQGSGITRQISQGSGITRDISQGSGITRQISQGSGITRDISQGSGITRDISQGSGITRDISQGSGITRDISQGSGITRDISQGSGITRDISQGSGITRQISQGSGITRQISQGSGIVRR